MTFPPGGGLHSLKPPERLPKLHICAHSREIQTGGQRPLMAGNLRIKHLDGPGRDDLPFLTGDGRHVWLHNGCHGGWTAQRRAEAVIRVQMIRQDTRHPDKLLRHPSRAWCQAPTGY